MDKATSDKMLKEVPTYKVITTAVLVDRLKVNASVARKALRDLEAKGIIKPVLMHSSTPIYTRAGPATSEAPVAAK
jgi:small subunit ribosomal protein S25e